MEKILIAEHRYGSKGNHLEDDDMIDRLNNRATVLGLAMCILVILGGVLVGKSINCWTPAEFKDKHDGYANSICWLKGSYYLPTEENCIFSSYYQWTSFILLGMSLFFLLPRYIWNRFARENGFNIKQAVNLIKDPKDPNKGLQSVQKFFKSYLDAQNMPNEVPYSCFPCCSCHISYTNMYFVIKILYIINSIGQFFLLNTFLAFNFTSYGPQGLNKLFTEGDWFESPRFPRVTMCDFMVRRLGSNQHWYSVQCNLPINMFNEKIFLAIWVWLIVLTMLNLLSVIPWILFLSRRQRFETIERYSRMTQQNHEGEKGLLLSSEWSTNSPSYASTSVNDLVDYLKLDGFLIFHIIVLNTDEFVATKIIEHLFKTYDKKSMPTRSV